MSPNNFLQNCGSRTFIIGLNKKLSLIANGASRNHITYIRPPAFSLYFLQISQLQETESDHTVNVANVVNFWLASITVSIEVSLVQLFVAMLPHQDPTAASLNSTTVAKCTLDVTFSTTLQNGILQYYVSLLISIAQKGPTESAVSQWSIPHPFQSICGVIQRVCSRLQISKIHFYLSWTGMGDLCIIILKQLGWFSSTKRQGKLGSFGARAGGEVA